MKEIYQKITTHINDSNFRVALELLKLHRLQLDNDYYLACKSRIFYKQKRYSSALELMLQLEKLRPSDHRNMYNIARAYCHINYYEKAKNFILKAIELEKDNIIYIYFYAEVLLYLGAFSEAWELYEFRKLKLHIDSDNNSISVTKGLNNKYFFNDKMLDSTDFHGGNILVYTEQGLGDSIQFSRYLKILLQKVDTIYFMCEEELYKLFLRILDDINNVHIISKKRISIHDIEYDYQTALHSLPLFLYDIQQLIPPPIKLKNKNLKKNIISNSNKKNITVGLCWEGSRSQEGRDVPLKLFKSLIKEFSSDVQFHSLQVGPGVKQIKECGLSDDIIDHSRNINDLTDTADLIEELNLVITIDTSIAHLSCALGANTWILLKYFPYWGYVKDEKNQSYWYPKAKLFCQYQDGNWDSVFNELSMAIKYQINLAQLCDS